MWNTGLSLEKNLDGSLKQHHIYFHILQDRPAVTAWAKLLHFWLDIKSRLLLKPPSQREGFNIFTCMRILLGKKNGRKREDTKRFIIWLTEMKGWGHQHQTGESNSYGTGRSNVQVAPLGWSREDDIYRKKNNQISGCLIVLNQHTHVHACAYECPPPHKHTQARGGGMKKKAHIFKILWKILMLFITKGRIDIAC